MMTMVPRPSDGEKGADSDREGSLTPTNESPPVLEEPTTPKDDDDVSVIAMCNVNEGKVM